jgi:hypothetical protein
MCSFREMGDEWCDDDDDDYGDDDDDDDDETGMVLMILNIFYSLCFTG